MPAVAVTQEAHERARAEAKAAGVGMGEWVSGRILGTSWTERSHEYPTALLEVAQERSETPAETLRLALEALAAPIPAVRPAVKETPLHADGQPYCSCDGEAEYGPHHREKCHRRTPV